jgi:hypothetical protein
LGFLTVDVTALGVVMTSDSQPIEILSGHIHRLDPKGQRRRSAIIERHGGGFDGLIGYVGTEHIDTESTRAFIKRVNDTNPDLPLVEFADELRRTLSAAWVTHQLISGLWVFIAGAEPGELRFRWLFNGDLRDDGQYVNISQGFKSVDDLDAVTIPRAIADPSNPYTTKDDVLRHNAFYFRNGALVPAATIFDDFSELIRRLYAGGYNGFAPISSLAQYGALVRMRQEFIKRMLSPKKGLYQTVQSPIDGVIEIKAVAPDGKITVIEKNA